MKTVYKNALINGKLVDLVTENGKFTYIGKTELDGIDLGGEKVLPGLIDIHTHGCGGDDTMDLGKLGKMAKFHAEHGVTSWLPTTMTASFESLKAVSETDISSIDGAEILGFHFEGPYIAEKYKGAQNPEFIQPPSLEDYRQFKNVKMITIAPELEGSMEFIKNCDCIVALGHTEADFDTTIDAIKAGANCLTHTFNAMPPLHHRNPGVIGAAVQEHIYAQVICDGLHIHPSVVNILYKLFGADRMVIISDSIRATGLSDGEYDLGGLNVTVRGIEARLSDGTVAGSVTPLFEGVKKAISFGIPEDDAVKMASETPATLLGVKKGKIAEGYDADFIVVDKDFNLLKTVIAGK